MRILRAAAIAAVMWLGGFGVAAAQSAPASQAPVPSATPGLLPDGTLYSKLIDVRPFVIGNQVEPPSRPLVLPVLYVTFAGLQAFDGYSTSYGINHGATEGNVLLRTAVDHPAALWAVKGGAAFTSIWAAERLWRRNRRGEAIAVMVAANAVMAAVAVNNYAATRPR
jgi:hypothetical protein